MGEPVQNTTDNDRADGWAAVYAGLAVALLVFAVAHQLGVL